LGGIRSPDFILVWDNASDDSTCGNLLQIFPEVDLVQSKNNLGFAAANNEGADRLLNKGADAVWILNNDTVVDPNCLKELVEYLQVHPDTAAVTCTILSEHPAETIWYGGGSFSRCLLKPIHENMGEPKASTSLKESSVSFMSGCSMLIRSEVLKEVGLFHRDYFMYYEDAEWSLRMSTHGHSMKIVPSASLVHLGSVSVKKRDPSSGVLSPFQHYYQSRNHLWTLQLHSPHLLVKGFRCGLLSFRLLGYALGNAVKGEFSKTTSIFRGLLHGWIHVPGPAK